MLPGASNTSSKRSSKDSERKKSAGEGDGEESEEDDGRPDALLEELCIYIIDALVNVLIVAGAHGGWYVGSGEDDSSEEEVVEEEEVEVNSDDDEDEDEELSSDEEILLFSTQQEPPQRSSSRHPRQALAADASGGGDYTSDSLSFDSDAYRDPYEGYTISQLSEFLSLTPTADTFKIGGRKAQGGQALVGHPTILQSQSSRAQSPLRPDTGSQPKPQTFQTQSQTRPQGPTRSPGIQPPQAFQQPFAPHARPRPRRSRSATRLQAQSESTSKYTHAHLHADLTALFKAPLMRILKKARVLNKVLGEEVVKCDLEALYVAPGVGYVEDMMERGKVETFDAGAGKQETEEVGTGDVDVEDDGDDTPRPGSSPSAKKGPVEGKRSPQKGSPPSFSSSQKGSPTQSPPKRGSPQPKGGSPILLEGD